VKRKKKKAPKTTTGTAAPKAPEPKGAARAAKAKAISSPQLVSVTSTRKPADKDPSSDSDVEIVAADINWSSRSGRGPNGPNPKRRAPEEVLAAALMDVLVPKPTGPDAADLSPAEAALLRRQQMRRRLNETSDWAQPVDVTAPAPPEVDEELPKAKSEKGRDVLEQKLKMTQKQLLQLQLGIKQQQLEKLKARMRGKRSRNTFFPARPRRLPAQIQAQPATSIPSPEPSTKPPPLLPDASASAASPPSPKDRSEKRPPRAPSPPVQPIQAPQAPEAPMRAERSERSQVIPKPAEVTAVAAPAKPMATAAPAAPAAATAVPPAVPPALRPAALKKSLADAYFEKKAQVERQKALLQEALAKRKELAGKAVKSSGDGATPA